MPSTTAQGRLATEAKSGGVRVRPMQNMMMPSRYGTLGPKGLNAPGSRNPATPASDHQQREDGHRDAGDLRLGGQGGIDRNASVGAGFQEGTWGI